MGKRTLENLINDHKELGKVRVSCADAYLRYAIEIIELQRKVAQEIRVAQKEVKALNKKWQCLAERTEL
jgi:hypothetical protein